MKGKELLDHLDSERQKCLLRNETAPHIQCEIECPFDSDDTLLISDWINNNKDTKVTIVGNGQFFILQHADLKSRIRWKFLRILRLIFP